MAREGREREGTTVRLLSGSRNEKDREECVRWVRIVRTELKSWRVREVRKPRFRLCAAKGGRGKGKGK